LIKKALAADGSGEGGEEIDEEILELSKIDPELEIWF
jgi:hypothetical protein